jgi:hypothetical protein
MIRGRFLEDADVGPYVLGSLGVEHVAKIGFVCRGVLFDAVALREGQLPIPIRRFSRGERAVAINGFPSYDYSIGSNKMKS